MMMEAEEPTIESLTQGHRFTVDLISSWPQGLSFSQRAEPNYGSPFVLILLGSPTVSIPKHVRCMYSASTEVWPTDEIDSHNTDTLYPPLPPPLLSP